MGDTTQWLQERKRGIGGSDVAPICGLSPWKSAYQVWQEKVGLSEGQPDNPAMAYGRLVEPAIRQWYSNETGRTVRLPGILRHPQHQFCVGSLDGVTDCGRVLEIKTARSASDWGEPGTDQIPHYYRCQIEHYLMVTGLDVADVVVSFAGSMPVIYEVPADKELQEILLEREAQFWELVRTNTPPEVTTYSDIVAHFSKSRVGQVTASNEAIEAINALHQLKATMKRMETEEQEWNAIIMSEMGESDTLLDVDGKVLCTWKSAKAATRFDSKTFQTDHPELYSQYTKPGEPSRRFLIK